MGIGVTNIINWCESQRTCEQPDEPREVTLIINKCESQRTCEQPDEPCEATKIMNKCESDSTVASLPRAKLRAETTPS
jgi:hypothetical protein